jgi:hypothetical protein
MVKPRRVVGLAVALGIGIGTSACVANTAVVSTEKRAYVVNGSWFGTDVYYCRAVIGGKPVCTEVTEVEE